MAISRAQLAKELEPGLNALFGMEYDRYENQHAEIYTTESSDRAFEEEVMLVVSVLHLLSRKVLLLILTTLTKHTLLVTTTRLWHLASQLLRKQWKTIYMIVLVHVILVRWLVQWHTQSRLKKLLQF